MISNPAYVVTDIEIDGPTPGKNSLMSFASVAIDRNGEELATFEAVLAPLEEARPDLGTMAWFRTQPQALAAATADQQPPEHVMRRFVDWVQGLLGEPIFVGHPLALDGFWIDYYLRRFTGNQLAEGPWIEARLFRHPGLCLCSFAAGRLGWPVWECRVQNYPADWLGHHEHTHRAIDDARGYARLLATLLLRAP